MVTFTPEQTVSHVLEAMSKRPYRTFATVAAALATFKPEGRFIGLRAYIIEKKTVYIFADGVNDCDFVPLAVRAFLWKTIT